MHHKAQNFPFLMVIICQILLKIEVMAKRGYGMQLSLENYNTVDFFAETIA